MRHLRAWLIRLACMFSRGRLEQEMGEELQCHLEMAIEDNLRSGMTPEEARRQALIRLGGLAQTKEIYRDRRGLPFLETLVQDVRYGMRMLLKERGFTAVAVVTLALGIGANSTIFTGVNCWMLRPPRIKDPGNVVAILMMDPVNRDYGWDLNPVSVPDFVAWRAHSQSFESMIAGELDSFALTGGREPERFVGMRVTTDYFRVLGVAAALGRTFLPGEERSGHGRVVLLSHWLWTNRFAADADVIGKTVRLNGESYTVAGVMPTRFRIGYDGAQLWVPLVISPERLLPAARSERKLRVLARLRPGVSITNASAEVAALAERAEKTFPGTTQGWGAKVMVLQKVLADEFKVGMGIQMGAVILVLLIACANIASLQLTRSAARRTEFALRTALGASRFRLIRQLLVESLLLAVAGGALGLLLASWGVTLFRSRMDFADWANEMALEMYIDRTVLAYTFAISALAAILFGLVPAFQQTAVDLQSMLKEGAQTSSRGRSRHRIHNTLVAAQVGLALALLSGAGLMIWGFLVMAYSGFGIDANNLLKANIRLSDPRYKTPTAQAAFFRQAIERLETSPGIISAGAANTLIIDGYTRRVTFSISGREVLSRKQRPAAEHFSVTPRFLDTLRVPLLRGRGFLPQDNTQAPPVAIVNEAFVHRYFGNEDPVGKRVRFDTADTDRSDWSEIVGVVGNTREPNIEDWVAPPQVYEPYFQRPSAAMTVLIRTTFEPADFAPALRRAIWDIDPDQPVIDLRTMDDVIASGRSAGHTTIGLLGTFAALALAMASVGVFGVMAYAVSQRTHEIGIRMALGARTSNVLGMIAAEGVLLATIGVAIGVVLATPLALLPTGMAPHMPLKYRLTVIVFAGAVLWLVAVLASYIPARRATRVDPTVALRCE